jgi:hypothetical protein
MQSITLTAMVDENGHLEVDVPLPPGPVELVIRPVEGQTITREEAIARLKDAGLLDNETPSPDALDVSDEELERLSKVFASERPISDVIDEDREDRW